MIMCSIVYSISCYSFDCDVYNLQSKESCIQNPTYSKIKTWGNLACRENAQVAQCVLLVR